MDRRLGGPQSRSGRGGEELKNNYHKTPPYFTHEDFNIGFISRHFNYLNSFVDMTNDNTVQHFSPD
jgi:hypothetical protein